MGRCNACTDDPKMRCGRCMTTFCSAHALGPGIRCTSCERDWEEEAPTRRAAKVLFAPPIAVLVGGMLLGLLLPIGDPLGVLVMCALASGAAVGAGAGACRVVDRSARALFLRERCGALPAARLLR